MPINSFTDYPMSWKPERTALSRPLYLSLASLLEHDITNGLLAPGTRLPPQRELADFLDVNFTTITRAYKLCELKGLIYAVTGSGTFVSPNAARSITISKEMSHECIELGFVESFELTNSFVAEAARKVMEKGYLEQLFNYNHPTGMPHQKAAALNWMKSFGMDADIEQVCIVSGAQNALAITLLGLFEPGQRIAVDIYTYANFIEISKSLRVKLVPIPGDEHGMLPHALEYQCQQWDIHGVFVMPSCSNPTAVVMPEYRKKELAALIQKHRLIVIEDDPHAFLSVHTPDLYSPPIYRLVPEQTIYICSTSKSICSGLRVAYLVFGDAFQKRIHEAIFNMNVKTSSLDAEIVTELILSGKASAMADKKKQLALSANRLFDELFPHSPRTGHPLSYYRWLPISDPAGGNRLESFFLSKGIRVYHSDRFWTGGKTQGNYLRIALSSTTSLDELRKGLEILKEHLET